MFKFLFRIFILIGVSLLIYNIPKHFLNLNHFIITKINIEGDTKTSTSELTELGKITYNSNVWELDFGYIEELLKTDVRIKNATVSSFAVGELTIAIEEREIFCYAQLNNRVYLVDNEGIIFGFLYEKEKKNVPLIILDEKNEEKRKLQSDKFIDIIKVLNKTNLKELISQIYEKDQNLIGLLFTDGTLIKTNIHVDKSKYQVLEALYYELIKDSKIEYIDLRFDDFVVKKVGGN